MNRLTYWRLTRQMSVRELAEKSGVAASTISRLENGHRKAYGTTIGKLAAVLGIDVTELSALIEGGDRSVESNEANQIAA